MINSEAVKQKYEQLSEAHPYIVTLGETALVFAINSIIREAGRRLNVPLGNGHVGQPRREEFIDKHPVASAGLALLWAPVSEELVFRELPARMRHEQGLSESQTRKSKIAWAGAFAAMHVGRAIPVPQLLSGLHYTRVHEKRGLGPAIAAHSFVNTVAGIQYVAKKKK